MLHWFAKRLNEVQKVKRDERGFTLIELLVVVIIIGILAAIAIPVFLSQRENAQNAAVKADLRAAATAQQSKLVKDGSYGTSPGDLAAYGYRKSDGVNALTFDGSPDASTEGAYCMHTKYGASGASYQISEKATTPTPGSC